MLTGLNMSPEAPYITGDGARYKRPCWHLMHTPLTFPSVHLASLWNVHGRSFLTHMVVIIIWSLSPCLLLLETRTKVVIPVTRCSQRLTGSNLQSCAWTRSQVISSMIKTPSPHLSGTSSMLQKTASQGQPQFQKSPTLGLTRNAENAED